MIKILDEHRENVEWSQYYEIGSTSGWDIQKPYVRIWHEVEIYAKNSDEAEEIISNSYHMCENLEYSCECIKKNKFTYHVFFIEDQEVFYDF